MAARQRKETQRYPILKYIQSPLAYIQYNSFTEILCNQKLQEGRNTSLLFPSTLQHFQQINHLSNSTKRLEAEIDSMLKNSYYQQQTLIKQRISFLFAVQQEKLNHALAALYELRWQRNALGMRLLQSESGAVQQKTVSAWLFTAAEEDFSDTPFDTQDLLLNAKFAASSGVFGNSSRAPVDGDLLQQMAYAFYQYVPGNSNTLLTDGAYYAPYEQINNIITNMLIDGKAYQIPTIEYDQIDTVLAAFTQIKAQLGDELANYVPFKPRSCDVGERRYLILDLVHQLEISAKRAQELLEKLGERGRMTYVGEFLQYATFPCFQEIYDDSSDASVVSSTSMVSTSLVREADAGKEEEIFGNLEQSEANAQSVNYPHFDRYCFCDNKQQDDLIYCESGEACKFAREGWFHPRCLGVKPELVADHFYCPGCFVAAGGDFKTYGEDWQMGRRKIQEVRKQLLELWKRVFSLDLSKKIAQ